MPQLRTAVSDAIHWMSLGQRKTNQGTGKKRALMSFARKAQSPQKKPRSNPSRKLFSKSRTSPQPKKNASPSRGFSLRKQDQQPVKRPFMQKAALWFSPKKQRKVPKKNKGKLRSRRL